MLKADWSFFCEARCVSGTSAGRSEDQRKPGSSLNPSKISPSAVPAAGGCSVLVTTISSMLIPNDNAAMTSNTILFPATIGFRKDECRIMVSKPPIRTATMWPPMTLRGGGCNTVGYDENDKGCGRNGNHNSSIKNSVFYVKDNQED